MEEEKIKLFEIVGLARSYCTESCNYRGNTATASGWHGPGIGNTVRGKQLPPGKGSGRVSRFDRPEAERLDAPKTPY